MQLILLLSIKGEGGIKYSPHVGNGIAKSLLAGPFLLSHSTKSPELKMVEFGITLKNRSHSQPSHVQDTLNDLIAGLLLSLLL